MYHFLNLPVEYYQIDDKRWRAVFKDEEVVVITPGEMMFPGLKFARGFHDVEYLSALEFMAELRPGPLMVLDASCGSGGGSGFMSYHGHAVTGIDADESCVYFASNLVPHARFIARRLPDLSNFRNESFEAIVSIETIEHVEEDLDCLQEFHRVLKPGGILFLSTPDAEEKQNQGVPINQYHVREYTRFEFSQLVERADFKIVRHVPNPRRMSQFSQVIGAVKL